MMIASLKTKQLSWLSLLLCLLAGAGLATPELVCRTHSRTRSVRTVRVDDHEHESVAQGRFEGLTADSHSHLLPVIAAPGVAPCFPELTFAGFVSARPSDAAVAATRGSALSRGPPSSL